MRSVALLLTLGLGLEASLPSPSGEIAGQGAADEDSFEPTIALLPEESSSKPPVDPSLPTRGTITRVIDGDTFVLDGGEHIRLLSVNAPEMKERIGQWAGREVSKLLHRKEVTLTYGEQTRDHYGRLIAEIYLNGEHLEAILVRKGLAHVFIIAPSHPTHLEELLEAQKQAREMKLGIWAEADYQRPLHITSFHANAAGNDRRNLAGEYLRIANISGRAIDLGGYAITNRAGDRLVFPSIVLPAGYTFKVISGKGANVGDAEKGFEIYWNSEREIWDNREDRATIFDAQGSVAEVKTHAPKYTR